MRSATSIPALLSPSTAHVTPAQVGELPVEDRHAARVLTGHLPHGVDRYMPQECDYMTMLREPVARVVSTYHHVLDHPLALVPRRGGGETGWTSRTSSRHWTGPRTTSRPGSCPGRVEGELVMRAGGSVEVTTLGAYGGRRGEGEPGSLPRGGADLSLR